MNHAEVLLDLADSLPRTSQVRRVQAAAVYIAALEAESAAATTYIEQLERQLRAAGANVDHMRGCVSRQIALRVEAQARAGRLSRDARR